MLEPSFRPQALRERPKAPCCALIRFSRLISTIVRVYSPSLLATFRLAERCKSTQLGRRRTNDCLGVLGAVSIRRPGTLNSWLVRWCQWVNATLGSNTPGIEDNS